MPPRPYLTREETDERLRILGFKIDGEALNYPPGFQKPQFVALQELIAGAISEWVGMEVTDEDDAVSELQEWTEEWLVG